jgi:outer membrane receptor protein involved in Fe transport
MRHEAHAKTKIMKQVVLILGVLFSALTTTAQPPAVMLQGGSATGKSMPEAPAIGTVSGKLSDSTGKAIAGASVVVTGMKMDTATRKFKEVLLRAATSRSNGSFRLEELPIAGTLTLKITAMGYKPVERRFSIMEMPGGVQPGNPAGAMTQGGNASGRPPQSAGAVDTDKDLGRIMMQVEEKELQGIVITASKPGLKMDIDKKVFNVDKNIVSAGGTAVDVMKNVPSLNVDIDGNVTLRNATPQVYVDGRPSTLSLDQIPADAIESVEVIVNPSAKYDASGGNAGILNIVLKKNKKSGYNGNLSLGVDKRGGINAGAGLNVRQGKFNFSANGFMNQMKQRSTGETHLTDLLSNPNLLVDQYTQGRNGGGFIFGKIGVDYFATERSTFSVGLISVHGSMKPTETMYSDSLYSDGTYKSYSERTTNMDRSFNATGLSAGFKYLFPRKGEEITADINYFSGRMESDATYATTIYPAKGQPMMEDIRQQIMGSGDNGFVTIQSDYVRPFGNNGKLEAGVRAQLRSMSSNQGNYFYDPGTGQYVQVPNASVNYMNTDNVYAAYLSYGGSVKNFGYKLGLRAERSDYDAELTDTKQSFGNSYPVSLFPSVFLSQKLKNRQELQLSYTRRVNRPWFLQLMPFIDSSNQLNWTIGNPDLQPEFTSSIEASYSKAFKGNHSILVSAYYKHTDNLITSVLDTVSTGNGNTHPVTTYINAQSSYLAGLEFTSQNQLTKWWDMNTNVNVYNSKINAENIGIPQDAMWSWFAKFNATFKLPKQFNVQFSGTYQSRTNAPVNNSGGGMGGPPMGGGTRSTAQGYIGSNYGFDLAVKKSFLKEQAASVTFAVSDIFGTRRNYQYMYTDLFIQESYRWPDSPMFRLTFAYRFGKMDMSLFKRKNMKGESEGMQGAMQMQ